MVHAHDQRIDEFRHLGDGQQRGGDVDGQSAQCRGRQYVVAQAAGGQGVAVWLGGGGGLHADDAAGAGAVFDHHALAVPGVEQVTDQPPRKIGGASGCG
ncbi:hypothetical protein D3C71_1519740 [compost metagenome]